MQPRLTAASGLNSSHDWSSAAAVLTRPAPLDGFLSLKSFCALARRLLTCSSSSIVSSDLLTSGAFALGTTETRKVCNSGGPALSVGWAVDRTRSTFDQSSPVFWVTAARYSSFTSSLTALPARSLYCGRQEAPSTR